MDLTQPGWRQRALCPAPAARWRPLPADLARGGGADKGGRPASPSGLRRRRRRAPRVAAAAPAPQPRSCRARAFVLPRRRRALLLQGQARGSWAQTESVGHPSLHPSPDPVPPRNTPKLGPHSSLGYRRGAGPQEREQPLNARPGSAPPLLPLRREFCANGTKWDKAFRTMEADPTPPPAPRWEGCRAWGFTLALRFGWRLVSAWAWLSQAGPCRAQQNCPCSPSLVVQQTFLGDKKVLPSSLHSFVIS